MARVYTGPRGGRFRIVNGHKRYDVPPQSGTRSRLISDNTQARKTSNLSPLSSLAILLPIAWVILVMFS